MSDFETYLKEYEDARKSSERKFFLYIVVTAVFLIGTLTLVAL